MATTTLLMVVMAWLPGLGTSSSLSSSESCANPACAALSQRSTGKVSCDVKNYNFEWGNKICEGILPLCVLRPSGSADVQHAIQLARQHALPLSYRSGGHSYTCNSIKEGSIHLDLRSLREVAHARSANGSPLLTFGTGHNMRTLLDVLKPGQTIVHGQCPTVGAGGLFLHGGLHTTLTLRYGRGNDTVTGMEVVTANGTILQLSDASPVGPVRDLWVAMRQAGSSFAIATKVTIKVFDDLPPTVPTDGGDFFPVKLPRSRMLRLLEHAATKPGGGLLNFIHVNGVDFLVAAASTNWDENRRWLEQQIGRKLTLGERVRSSLVSAFEQPVSDSSGGADKRFGKSGAIPYLFSSQEAFATVSFIMPIECYSDERMQALLAALPDERDSTTDLGCYMQVTTTYDKDTAFVDYNCAYDSEFYRQRQRRLNDEVSAICPSGMRHYINTPSAFYTPRDYFPNYDDLAEIKSVWDPQETFRVYQGIRPTGLPPDAYEFKRPYVRTRSFLDRVAELGWDALRHTVAKM